MHGCHPQYKGSMNKTIKVQTSLYINVRPYLKNNHLKGHDSSGKVPA
jgi:hypothetical protein